MERKPIKSSNLKSVGYDPATKRLHVEFKNGVTWEYDDVPPHIHSDLVHHHSPGGFFSGHIRGNYTARKL